MILPIDLAPGKNLICPWTLPQKNTKHNTAKMLFARLIFNVCIINYIALFHVNHSDLYKNIYENCIKYVNILKNKYKIVFEYVSKSYTFRLKTDTLHNCQTPRFQHIFQTLHIFQSLRVQHIFQNALKTCRLTLLELLCNVSIKLYIDIVISIKVLVKQSALHLTIKFKLRAQVDIPMTYIEFTAIQYRSTTAFFIMHWFLNTTHQYG